jgi:hypothetical protein
MEHPEPRLDDDGIAELFDEPAREEQPPRPLAQLLVVVLGSIVALAILAVAVVVATPAIEAIVTGIATAVRNSGSGA